VVCLSVRWSVCLSVGRSVTIVSSAKTAEPTEMPFGLWTQVGPTNNYVLDGSPIPMRRGNVDVQRENGRSFLKYRDTLP